MRSLPNYAFPLCFDALRDKAESSWCSSIHHSFVSVFQSFFNYESIEWRTMTLQIADFVDCRNLYHFASLCPYLSDRQRQGLSRKHPAAFRIICFPRYAVWFK